MTVVFIGDRRFREALNDELFIQVKESVNRVANCFLQLGFKPGDEVCLFMDSRPEFVMMWLGLSKIGVVSALVNNNLRLQPLIHSLLSVPAKAVIFGPPQVQGQFIADRIRGQTEGRGKIYHRDGREFRLIRSSS